MLKILGSYVGLKKLFKAAEPVFHTFLCFNTLFGDNQFFHPGVVWYGDAPDITVFFHQLQHVTGCGAADGKVFFNVPLHNVQIGRSHV